MSLVENMSALNMKVEKKAMKKSRDLEQREFNLNLIKTLNLAKYADDKREVPRDIMENLHAFQKFDRNGLKAEIKMFARESGVPEGLWEFCLDLTTSNMKVLYETAGWGWNPKKKKREIKDEEARLIIAFENLKSVGFCHFRFVREEDALVSYVYELQVKPEMARKGLGRHMMLIVELAARSLGMEWVMLTVLECNKKAAAFYEGLKYKIDETSPQVVLEDGEETSYQILSKRLSNKNK